MAGHTAESSLPILKSDLSRPGAELVCCGPAAKAAPLPSMCLGHKGMPPLSPSWWGYLLQSSPQKEQMKSCLRGSHTGSITSNVIIHY